MTGFGRAEQTVGDKTWLKSRRWTVSNLNTTEAARIAQALWIDIRNALQENLIRGTIDCFVMIKQNGAAAGGHQYRSDQRLITARSIHWQTELNIDTNSVSAHY